jgi:hypothetical protein
MKDINKYLKELQANDMQSAVGSQVKPGLPDTEVLREEEPEDDNKKDGDGK